MKMITIHWIIIPAQVLSGETVMLPTSCLMNTQYKKNTIIVPAGGYVAIQFISDNPGYWFLHCHIEVHQLEGMTMVINEAQMQQNPSPDGMRTCGNFVWNVSDFNKKLLFNPTSGSTKRKLPYELVLLTILLTIHAATILL